MGFSLQTLALPTLPAQATSTDMIVSSAGGKSLVAPLSGQSMGLYRGQVTHGVREVILCKDLRGKVNRYTNLAIFLDSADASKSVNTLFSLKVFCIVYYFPLGPLMFTERSSQSCCFLLSFFHWHFLLNNNLGFIFYVRWRLGWTSSRSSE